MTAVKLVLHGLSTVVETQAPAERGPEPNVVQPCAEEDEGAQESAVLATLDPSDRANLIKVVEIENELVNIDHELAEGDQGAKTRRKS